MICVSIGNVGLKHCTELLYKLDCAEIRLDLMELTIEEVEQLFAVPCTLVATCRPGKYSHEERLHLLTKAIRHGAQYVDIEFEAETRLLKVIKNEAKDKGVKLIISYHDFNVTPSYEELERIIVQSRVMGADLVKIAVMAKSKEDCATILSLYQKHKDIIAFGMGEAGMITRVAAPLLGADFTFAALDDAHATAPGQLTVEKMQKIYKTLNVIE
jgi:3-dehydroquinate dehydratase I